VRASVWCLALSGLVSIVTVPVTVAGAGPASSATVSSTGGPSTSTTEEIPYLGDRTQVRAVPPLTYAAVVRVLGGKGGGSYALPDYHGDFVTGGDGAQVTGRIPVSSGEQLTIRVGGRGGDGNANKSPGNGGWGATGNGGRGGTSSRGDGGGGGGSSQISIGGQPIVTAAGGGGAGGTGFSSLTDGGGPGGSSGASADNGHYGNGPGAGKGGEGAMADGPSGDNGGDSGASLGGGGGGGAAGYYGGEGGQAGGFGGGGGGGGGGAWSFAYSPRIENTAIVRGTTGDGNGLVVITWIRQVPVCLDQVIPVPLDSPPLHVQLHCNSDSNPSSFRIEAYPAHGSVEHWNPTIGAFKYVPTKGYSGVDYLQFVGLHGTVPSAPATVTFSVNQTVPPMTITASSTEVYVGQPPTLTVQMPSNATGSVGFYDEDQPGTDKGIGTADLVDGVATLTTPTKTLALGVHYIHASYGGQGRYLPNDSNVVTITVSRALPSMVLTPGATLVYFGGPQPTLSLRMPSNATGYVGFYDEDQPGTDKGIGTADLVDGVATFTMPARTLTLGTHHIHASYGGDGRYLPNDSNMVTVTVKQR
jgi:hypothetical protein